VKVLGECRRCVAAGCSTHIRQLAGTDHWHGGPLVMDEQRRTSARVAAASRARQC